MPGRLAILTLVAAMAVAPLHGRGTVAEDLELAIQRALEARLGAGVETTIDDVRIVAEPNGEVVDVRLAPGARLGQALQLRLATKDVRGAVAWTGAAQVRARIVMPHAHAARALARGTELAATDLELVRHEMKEGPIVAWPQPEELVQGKLLRDVPAGACIARTAVLVPPAVHNGQFVLAVIRVDGVEATARLMAADSGQPGAVIRVVNQESRRVLRARIVSAGTVEILP